MAAKKKATKKVGTAKKSPTKKSNKKASAPKHHVMKKRRKIKGISEQVTDMLRPTAEIFVGVMAGRLLYKNIPAKSGNDLRPYIVAAGGLALAIAVPKAKYGGMGMAALGASRIIPDATIPKVIGKIKMGSLSPKALGNASPKALGKASTVKILSTRKVAGLQKGGGNLQQGRASVITGMETSYNHLYS
jgi:hypothetical protein